MRRGPRVIRVNGPPHAIIVELAGRTRLEVQGHGHLRAVRPALLHWKGWPFQLKIGLPGAKAGRIVHAATADHGILADGPDAPIADGGERRPVGVTVKRFRNGRRPGGAGTKRWAEQCGKTETTDDFYDSGMKELHGIMLNHCVRIALLTFRG